METEERKTGFGAALVAAVRLVVFSAVFAAAAVFVLGSQTARFGVLDVRISILPVRSMQGVTEIVFNPFGRVSAKTHRFPSKLVLSVEKIQEDVVIDLAQKETTRKLVIEESRRQTEPFFRKFVLRLLLLAVAGGVLGAMLSRSRLFGDRRNLLSRFLGSFLFKTVVPGAVVGAAVILPAMYFTLMTFDPAAFRNPRYEGVMRRAPELLPYVYQGIDKSEILGAQVTKISTNISDFYTKLDDLSYNWTVSGKRVTLLHVSDIHNNPLAALMIVNIIQNVKPQMVLDTGDMTDHGSEEELELMYQLEDVKIPYYFIAGNHDSVEVVNKLEDRFGFRVLDGNMYTHYGLRILGYGDPKGKKHFPKDAREDKPGIEKLEETIRKRLDSKGKKPHILMVHDSGLAEKFMGDVPLILTGHSHNANIKEKNGTILVNAGTSGASGVRYFKNFEKPFYSAALITMIVGKTVKVEQVSMIYMSGIEPEFALYIKRF